MYLVNAHTLRLEKFRDETVKNYAIVSHRWKYDVEVSFQDIPNPDTTSTLKDYTKIQQSCEKAIGDGHD